jgi:hypothetical protein
MRLSLIALALVAAMSVAAFSANDDELSRLIDRAQSASVDQQARLYAEIAEREVKIADEMYTADKVSEGAAKVSDAVSYADKASDAAIRSGKHLKDTEIAMRKMAAKLRDVTRKLSVEDQASVITAANHLEALRTNLLSHMFKGKE